MTDDPQTTELDPDFTPTIQIVRHVDTGAFLAILENNHDVEQWFADFEEEERTRFMVTTIPGSFEIEGTSHDVLVLEQNRSLLPVTEFQLIRALGDLRTETGVSCRLFRLTKSLNEQQLREGLLESYLINPEWIHWWWAHDFPWIVDWNDPETKHPDLMPETFEHELWKSPTPSTNEELKAVALGIQSNSIFSSGHMSPADMPNLPMVFVPLLLGGRDMSRYIVFNDITFFYEHMSKAGPRGINGMPIFYSVQMLTRKDHQRLHETMLAITKALDTV